MVLSKLMWKEEREHIWKMVGISLLIATLVVCARLMMSPNKQNFLLVAMVLLYAVSVLSAGFVAAAAVTGDRSRGSLERLLALPVDPWKVFAVKTLCGAWTLFLPTLVWLATVMVLARTPEDSFVLHGVISYLSWWMICGVVLGPFWIALNLYVWTLAAAMGSRTESRAAMMGVLVLGGSLLWVGGVISMKLGESSQDISLLWMLWPNPLGAAILGSYFHWIGTFASADYPALAGAVTTQVLTMVGMWLLAGWRFGRMGRSVGRYVDVRAGQRPGKIVRFAGSANRAMFWKEWREVRGVTVLVIAAGLMVAAITVLAEARYSRSRLTEMALMVESMMAPLMACMAAVVIGAGSVCVDLEKRLVDSWRARPIAVSRWFWTKYGVGLVAVVVTLLLPLGLTALGWKMAGSMGWLSDWNGSWFFEQLTEGNWHGTAGVAMLVVTAYGLATFLAMVVRRALVAAIVTTGVLLVGFLVPMIGPRTDSVIDTLTGGQSPHFAMVWLVLGLMAVVLPVLAWLAAEKDWHLA